ncbi:MAG: nuclear transport factor 2 family protein [Terriglobales bacterium]
MRPRLVTIPLLLSLMLGLACTIAKEHPARNFSEATGAEALERIFWKEIQAGNWTEIERVLASNYIGVGPGASLDRTATLEQYRQWKLTDFAIGDLKTELNGPTFIVTYTITLNGTAAGQPLPSGPQHMMTVWQQQKSGWMVIAHSVSQP